MKSVVFEFLIWKPQIVAKIYFSSHSHCLLLLITQCGFLICSLYRIETFEMPFNFQPTIFRVKMQYNRPCKYSRPWPIYTKNIYFQLNPLSANPTKWPNTLRQFVGNLATNCLSVFGHFVNLVLKGLKQQENESHQTQSK